MLVFNQQANIKNVNGAIADIFANRPAPQSTFYLFYSIDTQEIYYDNGTWILIGTGGGGGGVNIYNSDGTLTGNRIVNCINNNLKFSSFNILFFESLNSPNYSSIVQNIVKNQKYGVQTLDHNESLIRIYDNNDYTDVNTLPRMFLTKYKGNDIGLKLDFANNSFYLGDSNINNTIYYNSQNGDFEINYNGGSLFAGNAASGSFTIGNNNVTNSILIEADNFNKEINTTFNNNINGLYLDFQNDVFQLGKQTGGNLNFIEVLDAINIIRFKNNGFVNGLEFDYNTNGFKIGDVNQVANFNVLSIEDSNNQIYLGKPGNIYLNIDNANNVFRTLLNSNDIGLKLDFANGIYYLGNQNPTFAVKVNTGNGTQLIQLGDFGGDFNGTSFELNDDNQIIQTTNQGNYIGLKLDFANQTYQYGQISTGSTGYQIYTEIFEPLMLFEIRKNTGLISGADGLQINCLNSVYKFGNLTGTNNTFLQIEDLATYPIQLNGTNLTSGAAGGNSGQHLKIKINGVDYKIELKNP